MGELVRIDEEMERLHARKTRLQAVHRALSNVACQMHLPHLPVIVPTVRAHGKFRGRGNLRRWLQATLESAYPDALSTNTLVDWAAEAFGLDFPSVSERNYFRKNTLTRALRVLTAANRVERLHESIGGPGMVGMWRLKSELPDLAEFAATLEAQGVGVTTLPNMSVSEG